MAFKETEGTRRSRMQASPCMAAPRATQSVPLPVHANDNFCRSQTATVIMKSLARGCAGARGKSLVEGWRRDRVGCRRAPQLSSTGQEVCMAHLQSASCSSPSTALRAGRTWWQRGHACTWLARCHQNRQSHSNPVLQQLSVIQFSPSYRSRLHAVRW